MNTRIIKLPDIPKVPPVFIPRLRGIQPEILMIILLLIWLFGPVVLQRLDQAAGNIDQSIWLLVVLSLISFLLILGICWRLLQHYWTKAGLPAFNQMVLQFNTLLLWQQLSFYWASFALLLLAAIVCLAAIC